jgi:hypothetical protein
MGGGRAGMRVYHPLPPSPPVATGVCSGGGGDGDIDEVGGCGCGGGGGMDGGSG